MIPIQEMTDNDLLDEFIYMTTIYRSKGLSEEERVKYKSVIKEINNRHLLNKEFYGTN